jgi:hypothetical protein
MREFRDEEGASWIASVQERQGDDYKGRFVFVLSPKGGATEDAVPLDDVRWNSAKTAERTLRTMSEKELRRRLGIALRRRFQKV